MDRVYLSVLIIYCTLSPILTLSSSVLFTKFTILHVLKSALALLIPWINLSFETLFFHLISNTQNPVNQGVSPFLSDQVQVVLSTEWKASNNSSSSLMITEVI